MFESITTPLQVEARAALNGLVIAVVVALSTVIAVTFVGIAVFIGTFNAQGALPACLAEIGYLLVVAAIAVCVMLVSRSKARRRAVMRSEEERIARRQRFADAPPMWKDKGVIAAALPALAKVAQLALRFKGAAGLLVAGAALGWGAWQAASKGAQKS